MPAHKGFDAARECASVVELVPDEYDFVARYYSHSPGKNLTRGEALKLTAEDLALVAVWESAGTKASFFNADQGGRDATVALSLAAGVGQPPGTVIYFAVDYDASAEDLRSRILPYFRAVAAALAGKYKVGVYGSGLVCQTLLAAGLVQYAWLACAGGWRGSAAFLKAGGWHIHQHTPNKDSLGLGFQQDLNDAANDDYGQFFVEAA